jgi:subtilisin-like proprotein convertase family protein
VSLPDEGSIVHTFTVAQASVLSDVNVCVEMQHTWVGDLVIRLESPAGTIVTLLDRPGVPASGFGCGDDDLNVTFDDASAFDPESHCAGTTPWYAGVANPVGSLASLNGESTAGDWKLHISDNALGDVGELVAWELDTTPALAGICDSCAAGGVSVPIVGVGTFRLDQNRPNPFAGRSDISFQLARDGHARIEILDVSGRLVRTLVDRPMAEGAHAVTWDGRDESRNSVAAGIYFYRLKSGADSRIKRMSVIR